MRVFLDTEFTDFTDPRLISAGLVAEDGQEFYCELAEGWGIADCSHFVYHFVLPLLENTHRLTRTEAGKALVAWLVTLGDSLTVVFDVREDWRLFIDLIAPYRAANLKLAAHWLNDWTTPVGTRRHAILESILSDEDRRHHALVDARALREAVLRTESEFKKRSF
ncbi:hypothetical protein K1I42_06825 [Hydrogenophilus thermoluteolus]|nr:hypothetical protein [Hydrogenophilus thermoluteolus]MBW7657003.1 hypothetical protein [Hydrogenophilus thermoluteolus]HCO77241.1 hypothetical protein [Rhodocyclaceae bacterium]HNQ48763.1 hypothetical protein [Hydrogenophilus thermoluteolus]